MLGHGNKHHRYDVRAENETRGGIGEDQMGGYEDWKTWRCHKLNYAAVGGTRGADLRLDWRRAFLSPDINGNGFMAACHSAGKPVNPPDTGSNPTCT